MSAVADREMTRAHDVPGLDTLGGAARHFFSYPSPRILASKIAVFAALRVWLGGYGIGDLWVLLGVAIYWPLQEWFLHQRLLHWTPRTIFGLRVDPPPARVHRRHHRQPWILEHVFLPPSAVLPLIPLNLGVWWLITPTVELWCSGVLLFTCAALLYEWVHYLTHVPYKPRRAYYRRIWRNHRLHHFKSEHHWHAFTVPWVDVIMGTGPDPATVEKSPTVRTLGVDDGA